MYLGRFAKLTFFDDETCLGAAHSGGVMNPARIISPTVANIRSDRECDTDVLW